MNIQRMAIKAMRFLQGGYKNSLGGNGERVDIQLKDNLKFDYLDMYQKSHYKRYEFAYGMIDEGLVCGDFACGTGYGSVLLARKASKVIGGDINSEVIAQVKQRYKDNSRVEFIHANILELGYEDYFDALVSFETLEHLEEENIKKALAIFSKAIKPGGKFIFSTPYMQDKSENAIKLGWHLTFYINEAMIEQWLKAAGFSIQSMQYQNYQTHTISPVLEPKDFIICTAVKQA